MEIENPAELEFATVFRDIKGIIIITITDSKRLDQFDMLNLNLAISQKTGGKPSLKLIDARIRWKLDKKARERAELQNSLSVTKARAVVVSNPVKASLFKLKRYFFKLDFPEQFFSSYEEAYSWLVSHG